MHELFRVTYDPDVDAAYIDLTAQDLPAGRETVAVWQEPGEAMRPDVNLDFRDGRLVGIEVLGAREGLHPDLLERAVPSGT